MSPSSPSSTAVGVSVGDGPLAKARAAQQAAWQAGRGKTVEQLLVEFPEAATDTATMMDLVYREILHRDNNRESPTLAEYRKRFPALAEQLKALFPK
jgi:hypothetical protein